MKCLENGQSEHEIVDRFEGDKQLVELWINFLKHNKWMEKPDGYDGHWKVTDKGKGWIARTSPLITPGIHISHIVEARPAGAIPPKKSRPWPILANFVINAIMLGQKSFK